MRPSQERALRAREDYDAGRAGCKGAVARSSHFLRRKRRKWLDLATFPGRRGILTAKDAKDAKDGGITARPGRPR